MYEVVCMGITIVVQALIPDYIYTCIIIDSKEVVIFNWFPSLTSGPIIVVYRYMYTVKRDVPL